MAEVAAREASAEPRAACTLRATSKAVWGGASTSAAAALPAREVLVEAVLIRGMRLADDGSGATSDGTVRDTERGVLISRLAAPLRAQGEWSLRVSGLVPIG